MPRLWILAPGALAFAVASSLAAAPTRAAPAPQQIDCGHLPPGTGMDRASCEQMNQMAAAYSAGQTDPNAARPGDDEMTCDQIKAELMQQNFQRPDQGKVAEAQAAVTDQMATQRRLQAEGTAMAARESAEEMGATAAGLANPVAGRAAQAALDAKNAAEQAQFNARAKAELQPKTERTTQATAALMGDMGAQLQQNPRLARLMYLADRKKCH